MAERKRCGGGGGASRSRRPTASERRLAARWAAAFAGLDVHSRLARVARASAALAAGWSGDPGDPFLRFAARAADFLALWAEVERIGRRHRAAVTEVEALMNARADIGRIERLSTALDAAARRMA